MPAAIELEAIECYEDCQRASHTKAFVRSRVYQLICGSDSAVMYGPMAHAHMNGHAGSEMQ